MNLLSLFSGVGGLELGLERAGMTVVGQVEIDEFCRTILERHWPNVPRHDDVRTAVEWWRSEPRSPVHVVAGGPPCQPVSLAGRRRGQGDERWMWPAMRDVIRELRPRYAIVENVPGLLVRGMGDILGDLAEIGYDAEWDCIPAAAVGAAHRRDRVFIVAYPNGTPSGPVGDAVSGDGSTPLLRGGSQKPRGRGGDVADTEREGRGPGQRLEWTRPTVERNGWWAIEPDVGRVAYGISGRVDRLKALGNAVVPQVAEHVGRLIMNHEAAA